MLGWVKPTFYVDWRLASRFSAQTVNASGDHSPAEPEPKVHFRLGWAVRFCCGANAPHPVTLWHEIEIFGQQEDFAP